MKLFFNEVSSASSRVRIALALKGIKADLQPVGIFGSNAENLQADYRGVNPQGLVPSFDSPDGVLIPQSLAIIEYIDEWQPDPPLMPGKINERALARAIALAIASEIHALLPPRVATRLRSEFNASPEAILAWNKYWVAEGFDAVEGLLTHHRQGVFAFGDNPTIAEIFLFPQAIGAIRLGLDLSRWPTIADLFGKLEAISAFAENAPAAKT